MSTMLMSGHDKATRDGLENQVALASVRTSHFWEAVEMQNSTVPYLSAYGNALREGERLHVLQSRILSLR